MNEFLSGNQNLKMVSTGVLSCQNTQLFTWHLPLCWKSWLYLWRTCYLLCPKYISLQSLLLSHSSASLYPALP